MRRNPFFVLCLVLAAVLAAPIAEAPLIKPKTVLVRGQVTDPDGNGVPSVPVRVLATRRVAKFLRVESKRAEKEIASTTTGPNGFYELEVPKLRDYDFYFLRFYATTGFDAVKFAVPEDIEITAGVGARRPVVQDQVLLYSSEWDAVRRLMELYGAESTRGRIVRQLGVPDRTERSFGDDGRERETWWYDKAGVAYVIEDGQVVDKKMFQPEREDRSVARQ